MLVLLITILIQVATPAEPAPVAVESSTTLSEYFINPFVLAIIGFFLLGLIRIIRYRWGLLSQTVALNQVNANYQEVVLKEETNSELIKQDLMQGVSPSTSIAQRIVELQRISERNGEIDQVALVEVLAAREGAKISIARYVASVLVLLGLCGAIWGLSRLVFKMSPALEQVQEQLDRSAPAQSANTAPAGNATAVQESFKTLISIMSDSLRNTRTAFYASLSGILASVLLLLANWYVSSKQVEFLTGLEDVTATKLIPLFRARPEATQLAEVVTAFREGSEYLVKLSKDLDDRQVEVGTHLDDLFGIVRKFREGADSLEEYQKGVHDAQEQMLAVVNQFMGLTARIEQHQAGAHIDIEGVVSAIGDSNKNLARAIDDWQRKHEDLMQGLDRVSKEARAENRQARQLAESGIAKVAELIRASVDQQVTKLHVNALELLDKQQTGSKQHMGEVLAQQGQFVATLQKAVVESDGHKDMLTALATTIKDERVSFADRMEALSKQNENTLKLLMTEQQKLLDISGMRRVEEKLEAFVGDTQAHFAELMRTHQRSVRGFAELTSSARGLTLMLKILTGIAAVSVPVFAALAVMFIFDLRPQDTIMKIVSLGVIILMIGLLAWFLARKNE
jgi:hypothetical protein